MTASALAITRPTTRWFRAVAVIGAVLYGLVALLSLAGVASGREEGIHRVHDLASVIPFGLLAGVAFAAQVRSAWRSVALAQLALLVAAVLAVLYGLPLAASGQIVGLLVLAALIVGPAALVAYLHPDRALMWLRAATPSIPLLALAVVGGLAATPYAIAQLGEQLTAPAGDAHAVEMHYAGMSVLVMTLALGGVLAALKPQGWKTVGRLVAASTLIFGVACIAFPELVSSLGSTGGGVTVAFGALYWILLEREGRLP